MAKDPVCGMDVNERDASATAQHQGRTFYFCSPACKQRFDQNPEQYARVA